MDCGCKQQTNRLFLEGEFGADPLWCEVCRYNLDIDEVPLSEDLKAELVNWANTFGQWEDLETHQFVEGGEELEASHNASGEELAKKVQAELGKAYTVAFVASSI